MGRQKGRRSVGRAGSVSMGARAPPLIMLISCFCERDVQRFGRLTIALADNEGDGKTMDALDAAVAAGCGLCQSPFGTPDPVTGKDMEIRRELCPYCRGHWRATLMAYMNVQALLLYPLRFAEHGAPPVVTVAYRDNIKHANQSVAISN